MLILERIVMLDWKTLVSVTLECQIPVAMTTVPLNMGQSAGTIILCKCIYLYNQCSHVNI